MLVELSYVCTYTFIANMDQLFGHKYCLRLFVVVYKLIYTVNNVLLVMYCMCLPAFFVTTGADPGGVLRVLKHPPSDRQ